MNYVVKIEGQEIPLPEEIAKDDAGVKRALAPYYPDAANAMITRVENEGVTTITVVKKAGTKGAIARLEDARVGDARVEALDAFSGGRNPAIELAVEIEAMPDLDALGLLEMEERINQAIEEGEAQDTMVKNARERLDAACPQPAPWVVEGF